MLSSIKERNKIINEYISNLDQKLMKHNDNIEQIEIDHEKDVYDEEEEEEEEEEDEFDKAEAQYKQANKQDNKNNSNQEHSNSTNNNSNFNQEKSAPTFNQLKKLYHSQLFKSQSNSTLKINNPKMIILKNPEIAYLRENNHMKKQQSLRRLRLKIYDVLPSIRNNGKGKNKDMTSFLVHNHNNNFNIPLTCSMSINPKDKKSKTPKGCLIEKEKLALKCLNDPKNPYSKNWSNHILKTRFNSKIKVNGFFCGIPQLKLEKLKEMQLPNVSLYIYIYINSQLS